MEVGFLRRFMNLENLPQRFPGWDYILVAQHILGQQKAQAQSPGSSEEGDLTLDCCC